MRKIANAPVSFGVFELSDGPAPLSADEMVHALAAAGYEGIDLGPVGYLGTGADLVERLGDLRLAGGWAEETVLLAAVTAFGRERGTDGDAAGGCTGLSVGGSE